MQAGTFQPTLTVNVTVNGQTHSRTFSLPFMKLLQRIPRKIAISGPGTIIGGTTTATYKITVYDSEGNGIPNTLIFVRITKDFALAQHFEALTGPDGSVDITWSGYGLGTFEIEARSLVNPFVTGTKQVGVASAPI